MQGFETDEQRKARVDRECAAERAQVLAKAAREGKNALQYVEDAAHAAQRLGGLADLLVWVDIAKRHAIESHETDWQEVAGILGDYAYEARVAAETARTLLAAEAVEASKEAATA
jgi:hypothetical protein